MSIYKQPIEPPEAPPSTPEGNPPDGDREPATSSSRWSDYSTWELLNKISEYEDERRRQRIREGIWISIILHMLLFSAATWIPRYIFHRPQLVDPFDAIRQRRDLTYLDQLPDALREIQKPRPKVQPLKPNKSLIDKNTMQQLKEEQALKQLQQQPPPPQPTPQPETPPAQQTPPAPTTTAPAQQKPALAFEQPSPVPVKPNFNMGSANPDDQLRQAMRDVARNPVGGGAMHGGSLNQHPSAAGGAQILSDTQGVDFGPWLQQVIRETYRTWDPLIPEEVNPPISKRGEVEIVFTVLPNGRLAPSSMTETGRSGDVALDRAAWGAITGADYPPLPRAFHGPYVQLRFRFQYNTGD